MGIKHVFVKSHRFQQLLFGRLRADCMTKVSPRFKALRVGVSISFLFHDHSPSRIQESVNERRSDTR